MKGRKREIKEGGRKEGRKNKYSHKADLTALQVNYLLPYFLSALPGIFHFTRQH
jgi:hypothetical protein